jgi:hypothetical protein
MRKAFYIVPIAGILLVGSVVAQVATTAAPTPKPTLKQLGMMVYPASGQTAEQQALDEEACFSWAEAQTGIYLTAGPVDTEAAAKAAEGQAAQATQGAAVGGAARGAVAGVAIGAIAGNAGKGAAIGAAAGAMGGMSARRQAVAKAGSQGAQQAQAENAQMVDQFKKAAAVCLEGRGYTAG